MIPRSLRAALCYNRFRQCAIGRRTRTQKLVPPAVAGGTDPMVVSHLTFARRVTQDSPAWRKHGGSQCNLDNLILCQLDGQPQLSGRIYICPNRSVLPSISNEKRFIGFLSVNTHTILIGKHSNCSPRQLSFSVQGIINYIDNSWAVLKIRVAISLRLATTEAS